MPWVPVFKKNNLCRPISQGDLNLAER
jgi:hypothetical protein